MTIAESIHGTFFYHWSADGGRTCLCGARVMPTQIPASTWGYRGHLNEKYCSKCEVLKIQKG